MLPGPAGSLEGLLEVPSEATGVTAVICHPHPAHGGAMTNKVAYTLARAANLAGANALRFNFRGVGQSAGSYDEGRGELQDTLAAIDWVRTELSPRRLLLGGFSFGAAMAVAASAERACDALVMVAPPVGRILDPNTALPEGVPALVVQGGRDELVDPEAVLDWCNRQADGLRVAVLEDADHFFHGQLPALRELLVAEILAFLDGGES